MTAACIDDAVVARIQLRICQRWPVAHVDDRFLAFGAYPSHLEPNTFQLAFFNGTVCDRAHVTAATPPIVAGRCGNDAFTVRVPRDKQSKTTVEYNEEEEVFVQGLFSDPPPPPPSASPSLDSTSTLESNNNTVSRWWLLAAVLVHVVAGALMAVRWRQHRNRPAHIDGDRGQRAPLLARKSGPPSSKHGH